MAAVFVGVGSNVAPKRHIPAALAAVARQFGPTLASPAYRSRAVGFEGNDFINLAIRFESDASPATLVEQLHRIETECGRKRGSQRFAPRIIDLDLLLVGDAITPPDASPELPRGEIMRYAFVLKPLAELAPDYRHPVAEMPLQALWADRRQAIDGGDLRPVSLTLPDGVEAVFGSTT